MITTCVSQYLCFLCVVRTFNIQSCSNFEAYAFPLLMVYFIEQSSEYEYSPI